MNTNITEQTPGKRTYSKQEMKSIKIDNQISMVMLSEPPEDPSFNLRNENPYKINKA